MASTQPAQQPAAWKPALRIKSEIQIIWCVMLVVSNSRLASMQPAEQPATQAPVGCKGNQFSCQDKMSRSGMYIISAGWHHNNQQHNRQHARQRITPSASWCRDAFMLYFRPGCLLCFVWLQQPGAVQLPCRARFGPVSHGNQFRNFMVPIYISWHTGTGT